MLKLITSILVLCPLYMFGQSTAWQEMAPDCQETSYFVQYISDDNHMIIGIPFLNESYITTDQGQSFQRFPWVYARFLVEIQSEENTDNFYFTDGKLIYSYEKQTESASVVHDHSAYGSVKKAVILENGEKLVIYKESDKMMIGRFDTDGELLVSKVLSEENVRVELLYQEGFPSYITKSTYGQVVKTMLSFNPVDLSFGNEIVIDASVTGMRYLNGRLFASNEYSDDGGSTWIEINSPVDVQWGTSIDILDNQVVVMARNHILHSTDYGETFTVKSHNLEISNHMTISFDNDGQRLVLYHSSSFDVLFSDDLGSNWSTYNNTLSLANTFRIASLENDHLMTNTIDCGGRYSADNEWNDISISDASHLWNFVGLPNGNYVGINARNIYLSDDSGSNWDVVVSDFYESDVTSKEGVVYITGYSGVAISEDNGVNYSIHDKEELPILRGYAHFSDLTSLFIDSNNELSTYAFVSGTNVSLEKTIDPLTHIDLETDWNGKGFYILEYESVAKDQLVIIRSSSPGSSFDHKVIPIAPLGSNHKMETDHNGNVLIYNTNQILISQDQGDSWHNITPVNDDLWLISDMTVSHDNYLYLSTVGTGVLKFPCKLDADITNCTLSVSNNADDISLAVYPNPFVDYINLEMEEVINFEVNIYDMNGLLIQTNKNIDKVQLESFPPGVYLLEVTDLDSSRMTYKKIVK